MEYCHDKCYLLEMVISLKKSVLAAHKEFEHFRIYDAPRKCRCLQKLLTILVKKMPTVERLMKYTHSTTTRHVSPDAKYTKPHSHTWTCIERLEQEDQSYIWEMLDDLESLLENANQQLQCLVNSRAPEMTFNLENLIKMLQEKLPKVKQILGDTCKPLRLSDEQHKKHEDVLRYTKDGDTSSLKSEGKQSHLKPNQKMYPVKETHLPQGKNISKQQFELEMLYERYDEIESSPTMLLRENMMLQEELMKEREHTAKVHKLYKTNFKECSKCVELRKEVAQLLQEKGALRYLKYDGDHVAELQNKNISSMEQKLKSQEQEIAYLKLENETTAGILKKQKQSFITEENYKLQTAIDKMREECLRNTEELRHVKENAEQKEGKYKNICLELKTIIDKNIQEIGQLKSENLMNNKLKEKYQRCQQEAQQLLVENHNMTEHLRHLRHENQKTKQNEAENERLNTLILDLRKQHINEMASLKAFFEKQQSETCIQHKKQVDQLKEEIQKCKDDLFQNKETQNMQGETVTRSIDLTCHNLQKEIDCLEKDNTTLREELEFERQHVQKKEEDFKNIRSEIQHIMEEKELEMNNLKVKYENHQLHVAGREVLNKNERLLLDTENLRAALQQEMAKAKRLENERDLVREELQQIKGEQFETMQKLTAVGAIRRKVSNENQKLKEEMSLLRLENINIKKELTIQQENARTHDLKEHETDNKQQTLREEIRVPKQKNENKPDKADLSDPNRPTRISQRYQDLYENEWADAYEIVDKTSGNEEKTIETLMTILMETMAFCTSKSVHQMTLLSESLSKGNDLSESTMRQLKNVRKSSAESYRKGLYMEYWMQLKQSNSKGTLIPEFVKECFEICWLMAVQDPPMILDPKIHHDEDFNKNHYTAYRESGSRIDYIVWPVMLLHENGPVLCKGVAAESH